MNFGVREICDVVFRAKSTQKIGNKVFYKNEPVLYFDTLKTSTLEGAATTVYAQGGRGNVRLIAWEGERTLTFTMEDALISPEGFCILSGAGLISSSEDNVIQVHTKETTNKTRVRDGNLEILVKEKPYFSPEENSIYVMLMASKGSEWSSEPYIGKYTENDVWHLYRNSWAEGPGSNDENTFYRIIVSETKDSQGKVIYQHDLGNKNLKDGVTVFVDYYTPKAGANEVQQIDIAADSFAGNFYIEASTLVKDTKGVDMPAEFIIPNGKIQSNFTFTMASSGDPSTFTFTVDAFPDSTRFSKKKVLATIQIINSSKEDIYGIYRTQTSVDAKIIPSPTLAPNNSWIVGKMTTPRSEIETIKIVREYTPSGTEIESWNADEGNEGKIKCYVDGTSLIIAGNGAHSILANKDSDLLFRGTSSAEVFTNVQTIEGLSVLNTKNAETLMNAFFGLSNVKSLNGIENWNVKKCVKFKQCFGLCSKLESLDLTNWDFSSASAAAESDPDNKELYANIMTGCNSLLKLSFGKTCNTHAYGFVIPRPVNNGYWMNANTEEVYNKIQNSGNYNPTMDGIPNPIETKQDLHLVPVYLEGTYEV